MAVASSDNPIKLPALLIRFCKRWWRLRTYLFGTIILGGMLNIVDALPLIEPASLHSLLIARMFSHWYIFLIVFVFLCVLTTVCGLIARLAAPLSHQELKRGYLNNVVHELEMATLQGIPAGLIAESVHLSDIFIPLQFRPNRPRVDYPLSEQEIERYRRELKSGTFTPDLQRLVLEAEQSWQHILKRSDRVGIAALWQQLRANRAIVIQGYPGTGKSTCMQRLTLHMALRGLGGSDAAMPEQEQLTPLLIPILLRLGEYAGACVKNADLSLIDYMEQVLQARKTLPGLPDFIRQALSRGGCLVMLDGLDEVSDPAMRQQVQEAIKACIREHRGDESTGRYNRFIITSRVAGYDQAAFPDYPHFIVAELTYEQIKYFLPRWYRANLYHTRGVKMQDGISDERLEREVEQRAREMQSALAQNQGVRDMAENPLLLTLLIVMQQNSIVLPRQHVELYDVITRTLLENRNIVKKIEPIPEIQAVQRLGPLAFQMQETNNSFARQRDVMEKLAEAIRGSEGERMRRYRRRHSAFSRAFVNAAASLSCAQATTLALCTAPSRSISLHATCSTR